MVLACVLPLLWGLMELAAITLEDQGSCGPPPRLNFAELIDEYKQKNLFPVGSIVKYMCRPGYTGLRSSSKCLQSQEWSQVPEGCKRQSCGHPREPDNGRLIVPQDILFGSTVYYTCNEGHRLIGRTSSRKCVVFDRRVGWTNDVPLCQRIPCFPPPNVPHGKHTGRFLEDFSYGTAVTYTCEKGHPLVGNATIYCTTMDGINGIWSGRAYCGVTYCPAPQVENGRIVAGHSTTYTYNQRVTLDCDAGHKIAGSREIHCQVDGTWEPPLPHCEQVTGCINPEVQNGRITSSGEQVKPMETITFQCDPGYILKGNHTIQCQFDSTWDSPVPICVRAGGHCGPPPSLQFAELLNEYKENNSFSVGSVVKYTCRPGYAKHPGLKASLTCIRNQKWSEAQEFCKRKSCGYPGEPENGRLIVTKDLLFGSTINYTCEEGYKLSGLSSRQCVISGLKAVWTGEMAICLPLSCSPPPDVPHGKHTGKYIDDFFYGTAVSYTCEKHHLLVGNATIYCTTKDGSTGVWSGRAYCGVARCPPPQVKNGRIVIGYSDTYTYNQRVTLDCNVGYKISGIKEINCQVDGTWDPPLPDCELVTGCVSPKIQNGRITRSRGQVKPTETITFQCDPGYILKGNHTIQCQLDSTWDSPAPICIRKIQCQPPPSIQNGIHSNEGSSVFTNGMFVKYTCEPGYSLTGEGTIYCTTSGTWSAPAPHCEVMRCPPPPSIVHGEYTGEDLTYGSSVIYYCDAGYSLDGENQVTCTLESSNSVNWSKLPKCKGCPAPQAIANGEHNLESLEDFPYGSLVTYRCDLDYFLTGAATIYCLSSGTWDRSVPHCKSKQLIQCPSPPNVKHGNYSAPEAIQYTSGKSVNYSCQPGYVLIGDATLNCTASGIWSLPAPHCEAVGCILPQISGGKKENSEIVIQIGANVTLECEDGYVLKGSSLVQCQPDFTWDPPVPVCNKGFYVSVAAGIGSLVGILLLLVISGTFCVTVIVLKQKKAKYTPASSRIAESLHLQVV